MVATIGSIAVQLDADLSKFSAELSKGTALVTRNAGKMEKGLKTIDARVIRVGKNLEQAGVQAGGFAKSLVAGFAGGLVAGGLSGIVSRLGGVARSVAEIGDAAKRAGVDAKSFQELAYVARQNRIEVDALTDGIKELNLRGDEFITTGAGPAAEAFQRLGFSADDLKTKLKNPSDLLVEIIQRLRGLDRAAQIRISDELFGGTAGERFVELLDQGADAIRDTIREANDLGLVLEQDVIDRAAEIDRQFSQIADTISTQVKSAVIAVADELSHALDLLRDLDNRSAAGIRQQIASKEQALRDSDGKTLFGFGAETYQANLRADIAELQKELARRSIAGGNTSVPTRDEWLRQTVESTGYRGGRTVPSSSRGGSGGRSEADAYERIIQTAQTRIFQLQTEQQALGLTAAEAEKLRFRQNLLNDAQRAGIELSPQQRAELENLSAKYGDLSQSMAQAERQQQALDGALQGLEQVGMNSLQALLDGTFDWRDALRDLVPVVQNLIRNMSQAQGLSGGLGRGGGGGGGLFGGLLSIVPKLFGLAEGGPVSGPGGPKDDKIPAMLSNGEFVVNAKATRRARPLLEAINSGRVPTLRLAEGGLATMASIQESGFQSYESNPALDTISTLSRQVSQPETSRSVMQVLPSPLFEVIIDQKAQAAGAVAYGAALKTVNKNIANIIDNHSKNRG